MLTAAIASSDSSTAAQLLVSLQQTGLVGDVKSWTIPTDTIEAGESIPDVVLLDLGRDPSPVRLRRAHSSNSPCGSIGSLFCN